METNKTNYPLMIIILLPLYFIINVYLLTPISVLFNLYKGFNGNGDLPDLSAVKELYKSPLLCFQTFKEPEVFSKWIFLLFLVTIIWILVILAAKNSADEVNGINYLKNDGTHGTANWMTISEAEKIIDVGTEKGIVFGTMKNGLKDKMVTLPLEGTEKSGSFLNRNVAVFGASGSMKSRSVVRPNVMQISELGQSMIITDPKGELFESMAQFLRDRGYIVKALNLVNMIHSDRWNPLAEVTDDISAQSFAETVMANTKTPGAKIDEFWDKTEMNLLKALALYVIKENPINERNLSSVYSLLAMNDAATIDNIFDSLPNVHPAKMPYNIYKQASENVRTGVVIGLGTKLQVFQNKLVQDLTATSDIDLTLPKKEKCVYFCITSDMESTFDFIAGLFFSFLFIKLTKYADYAPKDNQKDVYFILDEFPNIGAIPDFTKKISTMRSRGLSSWVIFQNIAQLENRYPNNAWAEIIGNCDSRLFLGCTDIITAKFVCDLLGSTTIKNTSTKREAGFEGLIDFGSISESSTERSLMNPDEILRLPNENAILILRGQNPLLLNKMDYTKHKLSKYMKPIKISDYKVSWAKEYYTMLEQHKTLEEIIEEKSIENGKKLKSDNFIKSPIENKIFNENSSEIKNSEIKEVKDKKNPIDKSKKDASVFW